MKNMSAIRSFCIVCIMIISFVVGCGKTYVNEEDALNKCKETVESICFEKGISDVEVNISYAHDYNDYDVYKLTVNGTYNDVQMSNIYHLVKEVGSVELDIDSAIIMEKIVLNDKLYELDILNEKELKCDDVTVYTYVSDGDKQMMETLKDVLPYVGMREENLRYTLLGEPDSVEKCLNYSGLQIRAKYKTYEWEETDEHGWYKITVRYRKHNSHQFDDYEDLPESNGYVDNITYTDESGILHQEYYADTLNN